jgi:hypothetical protein
MERNLEELTEFKYKGYTSAKNDGSTFSVNCDILNFDDQSFLFLPRGSKILAQIEGIDGNPKIRNALFPELHTGAKIFKYKKDKPSYREIARHNQVVKKAFNVLELWKKILLEIYENADKDIDKVVDVLNQANMKYRLKGSPMRYNIQRWIFDDEIISPDTPNIEMILLAASVEDVSKMVKELSLAYKTVVSFTIGLSTKVKRGILNHIVKKKMGESTDFEILVEGSKFEINCRSIASLERSGIEIDYHYTRKILY